jgi:hypothetical protein
MMGGTPNAHGEEIPTMTLGGPTTTTNILLIGDINNTFLHGHLLRILFFRQSITAGRMSALIPTALCRSTTKITRILQELTSQINSEAIRILTRKRV